MQLGCSIIFQENAKFFIKNSEIIFENISFTSNYTLINDYIMDVAGSNLTIIVNKFSKLTLKKIIRIVSSQLFFPIIF